MEHNQGPEVIPQVHSSKFWRVWTKHWTQTGSAVSAPCFHCGSGFGNILIVDVLSSHWLSFKATLQGAACGEQCENQFNQDDRWPLSNRRSTRLICLGRIWQLCETMRHADVTKGCSGNVVTIETIDLCWGEKKWSIAATRQWRLSKTISKPFCSCWRSSQMLNTADKVAFHLVRTKIVIMLRLKDRDGADKPSKLQLGGKFKIFHSSWWNLEGPHQSLEDGRVTAQP